MESQMAIIIGAILGVVVCGLAVFVYNKLLDDKKKKAADKEVERILNKAKSRASKIERDAKNKSKDFELRARKNAENEIRKDKQKMTQMQNQYRDKESKLEREYRKKEDTFSLKLKELEERDEALNITEKRIRESEQDVKEQNRNLKDKLASIANMTPEQAQAELKLALEDKALQEANDALCKIEEDAKKEADKRALRILSVALSRYASEVATERTVSIVALTSDEMKGKIIGREGRNIRALEAACGVDLIVDETPESVVISSFDSVRREIARQTLERLMEDGRVHPARIEEVVDKVKSDLMNTVREDGEKACFDTGVHNMNPNLMNKLGELKYRTLDSHNLYSHSMEVAAMAGLIADEIGANSKWAKRAGLLHAIGLAIEHTVEGSYAEVGADFAKRNGEKEIVYQAIRSHAGGEEPASTIDHIVQVAYNLVSSRPGMRRGMLQNFVKRLEDLESIGNSFDGVNRTVAIQSGKEIRVLVDSGKITDDQSSMLSRDIARKIERELNYPGQIKVSVVRETRMVEHAR